MRKDLDVIDIPPVLFADDVCKICRLSLASLDRHVKDGCLPSPINSGGTKRRRRMWSRESIERFLAGQEQSNAKIETPTHRKRRANVARADLERRGVKINPEN